MSQRVLSFGELLYERTYDDHLFTICPSESLSPPDLSGVPLHFKVFVTFRSTESECFRIVTDKHGTVSWVDIARAEITLFDTHGGVMVIGVSGSVKEM
jgi:hypothetical protein